MVWLEVDDSWGARDARELGFTRVMSPITLLETPAQHSLFHFLTKPPVNPIRLVVCTPIYAKMAQILPSAP